MIEPEPLQQVDRTYVRWRGRTLSYYSGCDYYRLASDPRLIAALEEGAKQFGLNVAASRLTTGNHKLYGELERQLAKYFAAETAVLVASGYMTNAVVAQAMAGTVSHALIDAGAHPALLDAARFLDCPVLRFRHRDSGALAEAAAECGEEARLLVLTDGMFSHNGSAAPLQEYLHVLPESAQILVDDAHGAGVLGKTGKGTLEYAGVDRKRVIQTVTLSKAFGAFGGAILGPKRLRERILKQSRWFVGSTPLPLPLASAALEGVAILRRGSRLRQRLILNSTYVKSRLREAGFPLPKAPGPIVALVAGRTAVARKLHAALFAVGIFPPFIKYPGGPAGGYFRFVICSEHTQAQLSQLVNVLLKQDPAAFQER